MSDGMTYHVRAILADPKGLELRPTEKFLLVLLATYYRDDEQHAFPSIETLSRVSGIGLRWTKALLADLEARECISVFTRRNTEGRQQTSSYTFKKAFLGMAKEVPTQAGDGKTWAGVEPTHRAAKPKGNPHPRPRGVKHASKSFPETVSKPPTAPATKLSASRVNGASKQGEAGFKPRVKQASKQGEAGFKNSEAGFTLRERSKPRKENREGQPLSSPAAASPSPSPSPSPSLPVRVSKSPRDNTLEHAVDFWKQSFPDAVEDELALVKQVHPDFLVYAIEEAKAGDMSHLDILKLSLSDPYKVRTMFEDRREKVAAS